MEYKTHEKVICTPFYKTDEKMEDVRHWMHLNYNSTFTKDVGFRIALEMSVAISVQLRIF